MEIFIVISLRGYDEFESIERCFSRESLAENYIKVQHRKEIELGLRKTKYEIKEENVF